MATHVTNQLDAGREVRSVRRSEHRGPRSVVAGGLTGAINILIIFPTEFIKTQLQLDKARTVWSAHHSKLAAGTLSPVATVLSSCKQKVYTGSVDVVKKTVKERGFLGLYRGVQVLLTGGCVSACDAFQRRRLFVLVIQFEYVYYILFGAQGKKAGQL